MQQYYRFKKAHPGCVLLFRIGDFYEMFDDDAVSVSKAIGLTLTQRTEGVPMCGMPYHQLETYLRRLLAKGFRVAVCDQVQDAAAVQGKSIIERAVTRVLTPGTLVDDTLVEAQSSARLAAVSFIEPGDRPRATLAIADLSTGEFTLVECPYDALADELVRRCVAEVLYPETADAKVPARVDSVLRASGASGTARPTWQFRPAEAREALLEHYGVATLAGFGVDDNDPCLPAAGAVLRYLVETQPGGGVTAGSGEPARRGTRTLVHLAPPRRDDPGLYVTLDHTTLRALEVLRTIRGGAGATETDALTGSLLGVFIAGDRTGAGGAGCSTPMGKRLLRDWLCRPLRDRGAIERRQRAVSVLVSDRRAAATLAAALDRVQDVTRIAARLALDRATPRDIVALARSLSQAPSIAAALENAPSLADWRAGVLCSAEPLADFTRRVLETCVESPPMHLREGGLFKDGVDAALDEARVLQRDAGAWLSEYQARLVSEHNLPGIKVGFNKVFGYYIELTKAQARSAPPSFSRRQTLTSAERYVTPELKQFEDKVTHAQERAVTREQALFDELCRDAAARIDRIAAFADACAELDALSCLADKAARRGWVRPQIVDEPVLRIEQGRHPVLDELLAGSFVPNDLCLGGTPCAEGATDDRAAAEPTPALALITGPNMAGKSTFIRQTALLVLLAHIGSFVPAAGATVGLCDRVFTRVGADDALHAGQSTFMVEMTETARILHHATDRSLVVLDEIGRGTSTLDGLSLAWAIAETLAGGAESGRPQPRTSPRTLFATHYHELTQLAQTLPGRVANLHVAVREHKGDVVFLHRILPGRTDRSYGVHVAKLAGLPESTLRRAREVLESLSVQHDAQALGGTPPPPPRPQGGQMSLFTEYLEHPVLTRLREANLDALTPLMAFDLLRDLKRDAEQ
jgi:DNA mismatch repair protein MutS